MINRFIRHVKEGVSGVARHAAMSISSASAVTLTLLLVSIFLILTVNLQQITSNVEGSLLIHVKIDNTVVQQTDIDQLKSKISAIDGVTKVTYSSREAELQKQILAYPEQAEIYKMYEGDRNPLRNAFYVETSSGDLIQVVSNEIKNIPGIEKVNYGGEGTALLISALNSIQSGGLILVGFLSILAIFLISNTIKVTIYARKDEITIMRTVGASNGFIRAPFLIEGVIIGLLGATIPIVLSMVGYYYLYDILGGHLFSEMFKLTPVMPFILFLALILAGVGILVGFTGSFISVTKYLRWKR